ncbi:LmeA family phospholipid-binding protein [Nocardia brasiliensis]|uniref:LmeA family phospholipid-binding protein n=1 Tax=Nocardia brasiliensis TaxID=37326 RepID=UPI0033F46919
MRGLLILIVVAAIALLVGDRVAVTVAQNEIGRQIAAEYQLGRQPNVDITGFPFLTQAVDGTYREIDIQVGDWSGQGLTVHDLDITLVDVAAPLSDVLQSRTSNFVAATATATAVVPYDAVRGFAPSGVESISYSPEGLRVTGTFPVEGIPVPATVVVTVAPTDGGIEVTPVSVQSAVGGPTISLAMLRSTLTFTVPLQRLPLGARLTAIQPGADGLHVTAVAHEVRFSDLP